MSNNKSRECKDIEIINSLEQLSIEALSDALDQLGVDGGCKGLVSRTSKKTLVGRAYTVKFCEVQKDTYAPAADYIDDIPEKSIIVIDNNGIDSCTVWGDILTRMAMIKKISGTIIDGACRDIDIISYLDYPLFSKYTYMKTGKNRVRLDYLQQPVYISGTLVRPGDYIKANLNGILVIPSEIINKVIIKAREIEKIEDHIMNAINNGCSLSEARKTFKYNFEIFNK